MASSNPAADNAAPRFMSRLFWPRRKGTSVASAARGDENRTPLPGGTIVPPPPRLNEAPQRRLSGIRPSPPVEPPLISAYTLGPSPSPGHHVLFDHRLPVRKGSNLNSISELEADNQERNANQPSAAVQPRSSSPPSDPLPPTPTSNPQTDDARRPSLAAIHHFASSGFRITSRQPVMNPQGYKLGWIADSGPSPPEDLVVHAELARHGGTYTPLSPDPQIEASYQVDVTPPVPQQAASRPIVIDPSIMTATRGPCAGPTHPRDKRHH